MYFDTSVLVPYYCPEPLSETAERTLRGDPQPTISDLVEVEFFSALARKVRERDMAAEEATRVSEQFLDHLRAGMYTRLALQRRHYEVAREWLGRFTFPLRSLDALHLALAAGERLRLATADRTLSMSARRLRLSIRFVAT
jgi:predicted nucleic acid-binding protein